MMKIWNIFWGDLTIQLQAEIDASVTSWRSKNFDFIVKSLDDLVLFFM